jgi:hypothetical protein
MLRWIAVGSSDNWACLEVLTFAGCLEENVTTLLQVRAAFTAISRYGREPLRPLPPLLSSDSLISSCGLPRAPKLIRLSKFLPGNTEGIKRHVYVGTEARYLVMDRVPVLVMMLYSRSTITTEVIFKNGISVASSCLA